MANEIKEILKIPPKYWNAGLAEYDDTFARAYGLATANLDYKEIVEKEGKVGFRKIASRFDEILALLKGKGLSDELAEKVAKRADELDFTDDLVDKLGDNLASGSSDFKAFFQSNDNAVNAWSDLATIGKKVDGVPQGHALKTNTEFLERYSRLDATKKAKLRDYLDKQKAFSGRKGQVNYVETKYIDGVGDITIRYDKYGFPDFTDYCPRPTNKYILYADDLKGTSADFGRANQKLAKEYPDETNDVMAIAEKYLKDGVEANDAAQLAKAESLLNKVGSLLGDSWIDDLPYEELKTTLINAGADSNLRKYFRELDEAGRALSADTWKKMSDAGVADQLKNNENVLERVKSFTCL